MELGQFLKRHLNLVGTFVLLAALSIPAAARITEFESGYIHQTGPNLYVAGIPTAKIEAYVAPETSGRQHKENWCWAATIQMALNLSGLDVTQEMVVERVFGAQLDEPAGTQEVLEALSGEAWQYDGRIARISSWSGVSDGREYIQDLSLGWPLLVGLSNHGAVGHAYLMTGITYSLDWSGQPVFKSVILRDPWPFNKSRVEISWNEYQSRVHRVVQFRVERP